jgi:hypothetical protein
LLQKSLVEQLEEIDEEAAEADADSREKARLQAAGIDTGADGFASGDEDPSALNRPESFIFRARDEMPHPANVRGLGGDLTSGGHTPLDTGATQALGAVELSPLAAPPAAVGTVQQPREFEFIPRGQQEGGSVISSDKVVPPSGIPSVIHSAEKTDALGGLGQLGGGEGDLSEIDGGEFGLEPVNMPSVAKQTGGGQMGGNNLGTHPGSVFQSGASSAAQSGMGSRVSFSLPGDIPPPLLPIPASNQPAPFAMSGGGSGAEVKKVTIMPSSDEDLAKMGLDQLDGVASGSWALPPGF